MRYLASFLWGLVLLGAAGFAMGAWAQQLSFKAKPVGAYMVFSYGWLDGDARQQQLSFRLPIESLQRGKEEFQPFDNVKANDFAFEQVKAYAASHSGRGGELKVTRTFEGYSVEAESGGGSANVMHDHMRALQQVRDKAVEEYMYMAFYARVDATHVMPDHKRIAKRYASALAPFTAAVRQQVATRDPRETTNYLLGFLQTIPYDTLLSRYSGNGAGFQTPYGLMLENKGDCDTKSVALAAALRGIYPTLRMTMVYVKEHAFIGVAVPRMGTDYALKLGGTVFVLADPTGPQLMRLGEVDPRALADLEVGRYSYQEIPF